MPTHDGSNSTIDRQSPIIGSSTRGAGAPGRAPLHLVRAAIGLDLEHQVASGERVRRVYLDNAASTLRLKVVQEVLDRYQPHYANTHSTLHFAAELSTREYKWAHDVVLEFTDADPDRFMCFFVGSGATGGLNRVARTLRASRPERDVVIASAMEHHSNDLPHRKRFRKVVHVPTAATARSVGHVDLARIEAALRANEGRVSYVAVTGVSNVTGIVNPIHEIAALAHRHGALVVVDAAQMAAHVPIRMSGHAHPERDIDVLVLSGHKLYAPGSPGVVVARRDLFAGVEPEEVGGGMVDTVWLDRYTVSSQFPDREEAGTPNIPGTIGLAAALYALKKVGMDNIAAEERRLVGYALRRLPEVPGIVVYGETDPAVVHRTGVVSFNLMGCDHAFCAAALNDYFNIAVRNECFCAHPYVRDMVAMSLESVADSMANDELERFADMHRGMVRASFGIYNTTADVDRLVDALTQIAARREELMTWYRRLPNGDYRHRRFAIDAASTFSVSSVVDALLGV
ncbi:MAG: aminotransferase class V-fold PLP-dependent enzyme [Hyphomicrobiales bacterium]|nr:aminotransferase class V-fold PLP-dependent enzyme [Hyphomicrobiales bacterium]